MLKSIVLASGKTKRMALSWQTFQEAQGLLDKGFTTRRLASVGRNNRSNYTRRCTIGFRKIDFSSVRPSNRVADRVDSRKPPSLPGDFCSQDLSDDSTRSS